jgi:endogenous inhibitor of DNA gyrase (YacG/DUF329 family)
VSATAYPCPLCSKPAEIDSRFFPFCSERCRLVDLASWFEGKYVVSRPTVSLDRPMPADSEDEESEASSPEGSEE